MGTVKVATCCYCGVKAALVLRGEHRHELSCGSCGAPLHAMKLLPMPPGRATAPAAAPARPDPSKPAHFGESARKAKHKPVSRPGKRKKSKGIGRKIWSEVWDALEDIFD